MVSQNILNIIIKAKDEASKVAKNVEQSLNKVGDVNNKVFGNTQAIDKYSTKVGETGKHCQSLQELITALGNDGSTAYGRLTKGQLEVLKSMEDMNRTTNTTVTTTKTKLQGLATLIKGNLSNAWGIFKSKASSALSSIQTHLRSVGSAFSGLGGIISSAIGAIGVSSISQLTVGLAMTRERMTSLTSATMGSASAAKEFVGYMDQMTNNSLVSLNDLGQAMNTIKMSTGMTNEQLKSFSTVVNDIGQRAILMGKDSSEAMTLMQAAGAGLNGEFDILKNNFGITKEQLMNLGWSGAASDVEGYQAALEKALEAGGSMEGMMGTTTGKIQQVKKAFTSAGRQIGEAFIPYINQALDYMLSLKSTSPEVYKGLILIGGAISGFAAIGPVIDPMLDGFNSLSNAVKNGKDAIASLKSSYAKLKTTILESNAVMKLQEVYSAAIAGGEGIWAAATQGVTAAYAELAISEYIALGPLLIIIATIAVLVAAVYEVGKAFGWWSDVGTMLEAIQAGIGRLWEAFINHPDVQAFIQALGDAFSWLCWAIGEVCNWLGLTDDSATQTGETFDIVASIINFFGTAWDILKGVIMAVVGVFQTIYYVLTNFHEAVLVPLADFLTGVFAAAWSVITAPINFAVEIFTQLWNILNILYTTILMPLAEFMIGVFNVAWTTLMSILSPIIDMVMALVNNFMMLLSGQITLQQFITTGWSIIWSTILSIGSSILGFIGSWVSRMVSYALQMGTRFVSNIINYIRQLPGKVYSYITQTASRIASGAAQWVSNARSKAQGVVSGVMSFITQLPGKVYNEFKNIGSRMLSAGSELVEKAKQIGQNIVSGLLNAMGIHSPGIIQTKVVKEFEDMVTGVKEKRDIAGKAAKSVGQSIVDSFNSTNVQDALDITPNVGNVDLSNINMTNANAQIQGNTPAATESVNDETGAIDSSYADMATDLMGTYDLLSASTQASLDTMVLDNQNAFNSINATEKTQMNSLNNHLLSILTQMILRNRSSLTTASNDTKNNLLKMNSSTKSVTTQMLSAWDTMKKGIITAANKIKTDATTHFNKLSSTIGSFYRKLQNPSSWGAGGGGFRTTAKGTGRSSNGGMSKLSDLMANKLRRKEHLPQTMTYASVMSMPCVDSEYMNLKGGTVNTNDLIRRGCFTLKNSGAGDWTSGVNNNVSYIKNKSNAWSMRGPQLLGYIDSGMAFKVQDFASGTPNISFSSFKTMAEALFSNIPYSYYFDSEKWGSWQNALAHHEANCSDGADALIALAHTCGFSAYKQHGHWNNVGHYFAIVNGQKMDTTGWQQRRTWTPSASAGPSRDPMAGTNDLLNNIATDLETGDNFDIRTGETVVNELTGNATVTVRHEHSFENLPANVDEKFLASLINDKTANDDDWIKQLVGNIVFQNADLKVKDRLNRRNSRSAGL